MDRRTFLAYAAAVVAAGAVAGVAIFDDDAESETTTLGGNMTRAYVMIDASSAAAVRSMESKIDVICSHGVDICLNQPWDKVELTQNKLSLETISEVARIAAKHQARLAWRVRGGAHAPTWRKGPTWKPVTEPVGAGKILPLPFDPVTGAVNAVALDGIKWLAQAVAPVTTDLGIDLYHGTWPNGPSAEMYATPEMQAKFPKYSQTTVNSMYQQVLQAWDNYLPATVSLEMPRGGLEGTPYVNLQKAVMATFSQMTTPRTRYVQLNWLDDRTSTTDALVNFDNLAMPPRHGLQMIHDPMYYWARVRDRVLAAEPIDYVEYYFNQFTNTAETRPGYRVSDLYKMIDQLKVA